MVKEIVDNFENAMKKGFISSLILLILEKEACHGYKIGKGIQERTLGVWDPPSSTLYTVLNGMHSKGLIKCIEREEEGRAKKVYEITPKGQEALKLMLEKVVTVKNSVMSFIASTFDTVEEQKKFLPEDFHGAFPFNVFLQDPSKKSLEERLKITEFHREMLTRKIEGDKETLENLERVISELKDKIKKK